MIIPSHIIPSFVRRLLRLGPMPPFLAPACKNGLEKEWFQENYPAQLSREIVSEGVDCLLICVRPIEISRIRDLLEHYKSIVEPTGRISILIQNGDPCDWQDDELDRMLAPLDLVRYHKGCFNDESAKVSIRAMTLVAGAYNPIAHARHLSHSGRPDCAVDVIEEIPGDLITTPTFMAGLALEKQKFYLQWQKLQPDSHSTAVLFCKERREFAQVTALDPHLTQAYECHARFWSCLGRDDMAARVLPLHCR